MKKYLIFIAIAALIWFAGCYSRQKPSVFQLGIDPSFIPLNTMGQETYLNGYCQEVFYTLARSLDEPIELIKLSWDDLLPQLKTDKLAGIITTLTPYNFYKKDFLFSNPLLLTGPVLISKKQVPYTSLERLNGKIVGIIGNSNHESIIEPKSSALIQSFENPSSLLDALVQGQIDSAFLDYLIAFAYCKDLYNQQLVITSGPMGEDGIRFMIKKTDLKAKAVLEALNAYLNTSETDKLLSKWNLPHHL